MSFFGYLSEFWNGVASATADTVAWFQSLGNAVAGAMGHLLIALIQPIVDFILVFAYFLTLIKAVFLGVASMGFWVYNFALYFMNGITSYSVTNYWDVGSLYFLNSIPFWGLVGLGLEVMLMFKALQLIYKTVNV